MSEVTKPYVTYGNKTACSTGGSDCGCGSASSPTSLKVNGCRFTLNIMSDDFINIILDSLKKTKTDKVWQMTDELSTVYRGKQVHVMDSVKACFINAFKPGVHMTSEMTFSRGCPGDVDADSFMNVDDVPVNEPLIKDVHFPVMCKIAFYPMGIPDYMRHIATIVNHAIDLGIYERSSHYCTILKGDVQDIFAYFNYVNTYGAEHLSHYILEATVAANIPEEEK
ncbi:MAG: YkoF family thiamine/hydroxymethylpyrimidine-binding protein [Lactimicrobium sp.]|jgi:hypothetical protein|uniref:YkoF family thiamine/hydroxymethylpyrimidine-binding protein n=1 Tax=Lactimicrobium sp. TaxID=2563780 RepID=UPI002F35C3E9